jgi:hypothetical protein
VKNTERLQGELSSTVHDLNNIINTLNGYAELLTESTDSNSQDEIGFYKEKIVATLIRKLPSLRRIAERLHTLQGDIDK